MYAACAKLLVVNLYRIPVSSLPCVEWASDRDISFVFVTSNARWSSLRMTALPERRRPQLRPVRGHGAGAKALRQQPGSARPRRHPLLHQRRPPEAELHGGVARRQPGGRGHHVVQGRHRLRRRLRGRGGARRGEDRVSYSTCSKVR